MNSSLDPQATWDDQGLWFAMVLNSALLVILSCVSIFLLTTPVLWLRRLYRVNHTTIVSMFSPAGSPRPVTTTNSTTVGTTSHECTPSGSSKSPNPRIKHEGRALAYRCSLFTLPTWRDWLSVEENVLHLDGFMRQQNAVPPSFYEGASNNNNSHIIESNEVEENEKQTIQTRERIENSSSYSSIHEGRERQAPPPQSSPASGSSPGKAMYDPQVALYLAFLKLFATVFIVGGLLNIWICVLSATDDYIVTYMVKRDMHRCRPLGDNETACNEKAPFCHYLNFDCHPARLHGLYDLSTQNIHPRSWRLWLVAVFDMFFCGFYVIAVLFFLRRANTYVMHVMKLQMKYALGHRVVIVRGVRTEMLSDTIFRENFLTEEAYFHPRRHNNKRYNNNNNSSSNNSTKGNTYYNLEYCSPKGTRGQDEAEEYEDDDDVYYQCDCTGLSCLFSIVGFTYYKTTPKNAVFTREGSVKELLFPRQPPSGMYDSIEKTEHSMEDLQEAIADQKAYVRRKREERERRGGGEENYFDSDDVVMVRAPFPSCCTKVPKVEFLKKVFVKESMKLNKFIDAMSDRNPRGSAFIIFSDALSAYEFVNLFESRLGGVSGGRATIAGPPEGIIHFNIATDRYAGWIRTLLFILIYISLLFFWAIPVGFVSSLDNLTQIPGIGKYILHYYITKTPESVRSVITSFLPVMMLALFNIILPFIIRGFVIAMGVINKDELHGGELHLQYVFMVLTGVIIQAALQGSMFQLADLIFDPKSEAIISFFTSLVSPQGGYWYAKVITAACVSTWLQFIDPIPLLMALCRRQIVSVQRLYDHLFNACVFEWPQLYSFDLTILSMGLLFHMTAPLLSLLVGLYFVVRYITQRCRLYDRYQTRIHPVHQCTVFSASAQVIRAASWLHCVGGVGGVLFMSLRNHIGGVVLCSISLAVGMLLGVYVHFLSRRWINSLANAREFIQTPYNNNNNNAEDVVGSTVQTTHVCSEEYGAERVSPIYGSKRENVSGHDCRMSCHNHRKFSSMGLLQRDPDVCSRYQPKHQQLVHIDVQEEITRMEETECVVERYWDVPFELVDPSVIQPLSPEEGQLA